MVRHAILGTAWQLDIKKAPTAAFSELALLLDLWYQFTLWNIGIPIDSRVSDYLKTLHLLIHRENGPCRCGISSAHSGRWS